MNNILTAADARKIAEGASFRYFEEALQRAIKQISCAAKQGKYNTDICINALITAPWEASDSEIFVNYLQELGYKTQKIRKDVAYPGSDKYLYFVTVNW